MPIAPQNFYDATGAPETRPERIRRWMIVISGFRQDEGELHGMMRLWHALHCRNANGTTAVLYKRWNSDWDKMAEQIDLCSGTFGRPFVQVYAYSFGAGWGFPRLAEALAVRDVWINNAVLCDPVYRHPNPLCRWFPLFNCGRIVVPGNVRNVKWFTQPRSWPRPSPLVAADPEFTRLDGPTVLPATDHWHIDEATAFHRCAHDTADGEV